MIIIASNTATSMALEKAKSENQIPVQGVIKPAIHRVIKMTRNKRIGIIGTPVTIKKNLHEELLMKIDPDIKVFKKACKKDLIQYVENGFQEDKNNISEDIRSCVRGLVVNNSVDTIVLGCTHYSFLKEQIAKELGKDIKILDPAEATVLDCKDILENTKTIHSDDNRIHFKKYTFFN